IAIGYFLALFAWYAVQVHQTKYLVEVGFSPALAGWALGLVSLVAVPGQIALGHLSDRIGREWVWTVGCLGFVLCFLALLALRHPSRQGVGGGAGCAWLGARRGRRRVSRRVLRGPPLRRRLRHAHVRSDRRRRGGAVGRGRALRPHGQLHAGLLDRHRRLAAL